MPHARLLMFCLVFLTLAARIMAQGDNKAKESTTPRVKLIRGKTLDAWIVQAKKGATLEDRHNALQVLRNDGLSHDRARTLRAFADALSDKTPSVRSLAAAGLIKAGKPTDPRALKKLVELISKDLSATKPPQLQPGKASTGHGKASKASSGIDFPVREIRALGELGEAQHILVLRRITANKKVHPLLRQFAENAIRQIKKRVSEVRSVTDDRGK